MKRPVVHTILISNAAEEKKKFFSLQKYNPQFVYIENVQKEILTKYGLPSEKVFTYASDLIEKTFQTDSFASLESQEGAVLSAEETEKAFHDYLHQDGLLDQIIIRYQDNFSARTGVNITPDKKVLLKIKTPVRYRKDSIQSVLDHEIGTHVFRWINEIHQPWFDQTARETFHDHLETEEGLASLHTLLSHPVKKPVLAALYYYAVFLAQQLSFYQLYQQLEKTIHDPDFSWLLCVRAKRGLANTEEAGGYTKDLVYLQGMIHTAKWLKNHDYNTTPLYLGKIASEDVEHCLSFPEVNQPILPLFIQDPNYRRNLAELIGQNNFLAL